MERDILEEAAEGGEEALGFSHFSTLATAHRQDHSSHRGTGTTEFKNLSLLGEDAAAPAMGVPGRKTPALDEDRDVRELESMLMGLEAEEELDNNVPVVHLTADGKEADLAQEVSAESSSAAFRTDRDRDGDGGVLVSEADQNPSTVGSYSPVAFTIDEDASDAAQAPTLGGSSSLSPAASAAAAAAAAATADLESTRELLGSITATLTPSAPDGGNGEIDSESGDPLRVTRSELALVNLMKEAEQEPGGLSELPLRPPSDNVESALSRLQPGQSSFDDALLARRVPFASGEGDVGMNGGSSSQRAFGATTSHERVDPSGSGSSFRLEGPVNVPAREKSAPEGTTTTAAAEYGRVLRSSSAPRGEPVFSLGHDRWVKCGFTSAHAVGREGQDEASIGRALRDASSVLALDSVNYFLARWDNMPTASTCLFCFKTCCRQYFSLSCCCTSG